VQNEGVVAAGISKMRYYLSLDAKMNTGDLLLTGSRAVPGLASGASSSGGTNVTISKASIGSYYLLACADDTKVVAESNEKNNCQASLTTMLVKGVDLLETTVSNPPAAVALGGSFSETDTAMNQGNLASGATKTRYYLSLDKVRNAGDRLLTGARYVSLAPFTSSTGAITVKVPATTPKNAYYLLACSDDTKAVKEVNENNNCRASTSKVTVQ
jgi:subtilase family serine protease